MNSVSTWPGSAIAWLDDKGKLAWIALMVVAFIIFWPLGLALLFFLLWSERMGKSKSWAQRHMGYGVGFKPSGNSAFDNYKAETLRRLEEDQAAFEAYLQRLRDAKDKSEFDQFMDERARKADSDRQEL